MIIKEEDYIEHYGMPRRSGRYPWGSGENPYQRNQSFLGEIVKLRGEGLSEAQIARAFDMTTTELRALKSIARNENKQMDISQAQRLKDRGWSNVAIGERMGIAESSVRALLAPGARDKAQVLDATANMLKRQVAEKGLVDIGVGVEHHVEVSRNKLDVAVAKLREEGYKVHYVKVKQLGTGKFTTVVVLSEPGVEYGEVFKNRDKIRQITEHSDDGGRTWLGIRPPTSIDSSRVAVNYAEDGGAEADGVIYVRPGVDDISLGDSSYAQVRIAVDGTHFLKGMAMYNPNMPPGKDLLFNTNKSKKAVSNDKEAMKPLKDDPDNPFGAVIKPGGQRGVMNVINEEGDWGEWAKSISSQMLSKQSPMLAKTQLNMTYERKANELNEILQLTNPAVRRRLLESFSDSADSSAVHLKAAALPRQSSQVILPVNSMKSNEIYAPNYRNGERVVLVRYPHGGIFEIPELTVNNRQRDARSLLGNARDAVAINSQVAERLSGADFDGDTVLVIPNNQGKVKTAQALEGLKNFDAKRDYAGYEGMKRMKPGMVQYQMGGVSNLITDMTIRGASAPELARAVRHSMVVIDAEKHGLDYRRSAKENGIAALKAKYQEGSRSGASTLISRASSEERVPDRKPRPASEGGPIDKATGKKVFVETGASYVNREGKTVNITHPSTKAGEADDLHTLSSGTPIEKIYADHGNRLKTLANQARREMVATKNTPYSPSAKAAYAEEVTALNSKLNTALRNAPLERQAQIVAGSVVRTKRAANPDMDPAEVKKLQGQALTEARVRVGASKHLVEVTPKEWEAIQAGAISNHKLEQILRNADLDTIKQLATPKSTPTMTTARANRAKAMAAAGYTQAEIADHLGVSVSTITDVLN